ncbi:MAG TPA: LysR family transcriptional regulator [Pseudonocardia sp.]
MPTEFSTTGLRVLVEIAQSGSFSAAARVLDYTQSAVSRQVAGLEKAAGRPLFERRRDGVVLTQAGARLLAHAIRALDELDAAAREVSEPDFAGPVRLGAFASAAAALVPAALATLPRELVVTVREGSTPSLTRALRAGTLDLAVLAQTPPFRPLDAETPALALTLLVERDLVIVVGPRHPFARRRSVELGELAGQVWVGGRGEAGDTPLGVWPGLAERPDVRFVVRDWLTKLQFVAADLAITTLPPVALGVLPEGVHAVAVRGEPQEARRLVLGRLPGPLGGAVATVADALATQCDRAHTQAWVSSS